METPISPYIQKYQKEMGSFGNMPDPLTPFEQKLDPAFGLQVCTAIQHEWFNGDVAYDKSSLFMGRHQWIREMRLYNRGEQDPEKYKKHIARQDGDSELLNMDWNLINVVEKFNNIVRNGLGDEYYRVDVRSADQFAVAAKEESYWAHRKNMASQQMLEQTKELFGVDMTHKGFVPQTEEELFLYTELKERPKQEIAEQIMIKYVKESSDWKYIKKECDRDSVVADLRIARIYTHPINGVQMTYVDPETYGHSYVERNDFKDAYYHFWIESKTINDLRKTGQFQDYELREIAKKYAAYNNYQFNSHGGFSQIPLTEFLNFDVHVMHFCYKTDKEIVFKAYQDKRNGGINKVARRGSDYQPPEGKEDSKISLGMDTWLEGSYVVGSNKYLYDYKESENISRDEQDRAMCPFVVRSTNIYKNKLRSFQSNIIPAADQLQYFHFKIQHLAAELKPDLIVLDVDALATLSADEKGEAKADNWKQHLSILGVKGYVLKKRINMGEDGLKDAEGAKPHAQQQGSALVPLLNLWAHYYNFIRESTGINPAMDGTVNPQTLVGVNEMMRLQGNKATKHLVEAAQEWDKEICRTISTRLKSIFDDPNHKRLQKMYEQAVGVHNVEALRPMKNRHLYDFGYSVALVPSQQEIEYLRQDLTDAQKEGTIDVSDKTKILNIAMSDIEQAQLYMSFVRKRNIRERLKEKQMDFENQRQTNAQAAQQKMQGEMQVYQFKKQIDLQAKAQESAIDIQKELAIKQGMAPFEEIEFNRDVYLQRITALTDLNVKAYMEDRKDDRQSLTATQNSQMINQRSLDLPPIDFNNQFDMEKLLDL